MNVKELKERLALADDEDDVFVRFPDLGTGGHTSSEEITTAFKDTDFLIIVEC